MFKHYYLSFKGRCSRREYWLFGVLPFLLIGLPVSLLAYRAGPYYLLAFALLLIAMLPLVMVQAKRYHDLDMSGWFCLLNLLPLAGKIMLIIVGILPGKPGENRYGPDQEDRTTVVSEPRRINSIWVVVMSLVGIFAYVVFAMSTGFKDFTILGRNEEGWMIWRYINFGSWLSFAIVIYLIRDQKVYVHTLWTCLAVGVLIVMVLVSGYLVSHEALYLYLTGSALAYVYLAGMLSLTIKNMITATVSIFLFVGAQMLVDGIVLAIAGQLKIGM